MCDNRSVNIVCLITAGPSVPAIAAMQLMYHSVPCRTDLSGSSAGEPVFCYVFNEHKNPVLVSYCTICQTGRAKQLELHRLQPSTVVSAVDIYPQYIRVPFTIFLYLNSLRIATLLTHAGKHISICGGKNLKHILLMIQKWSFVFFFHIPKVWVSLNDAYKNRRSILIKRDVLQSRMAKFVQGKVNFLRGRCAL